MRKSIVPMWTGQFGRNCDALPLPRSHRCDDFPAEYSLASPPRRTRLRFLSLAHAATSNLVRRAKLSEWQPGTFSSVSLQGVTPSYQGTIREPAGKLLARAELLKPESMEPGTFGGDTPSPTGRQTKRCCLKQRGAAGSNWDLVGQWPVTGEFLN